MLKESKIVEIENVLEDSQAEFDDFDLEVEEFIDYPGVSFVETAKAALEGSEPRKGARVTIEWRYNPDYRFVGLFFSNGYEATLIPGSLLKNEQRKGERWSSFLRHINSWVDNIYEDLMTKPVARQVKSLREDVDELLKQMDKMPDEPFSKEEGEELRQRLDDLEESFANYYEQNEEDKEQAQREIDELREELEFLRATTYHLTKRNWAHLAIKKLEKIINSPAGQTLLKEGAPILFQKLLPPPGS